MIPTGYTGPAIWRNKDYDLPITITGYLGQENGSGPGYFSYAESSTGAPANEIKFPVAAKVANIPNELKKHRNWVCWRYESNGNNKPAKIPYCPTTGKPADTTDPQTWVSFDTAIQHSHKYDGIGFMLHPETTPLVGIDIDDCVFSNGQLTDFAENIVTTLNSYTEVSPSGKGIRIFVIGDKPGPRCKHTDYGFEMYYGLGRYLTVTGDHLADTPLTINRADEGIKQVYYQVWPEKPKEDKPRQSITLSLDDSQIVELATEHNPKFRRLYAGDFSDYPSQSEADSALCSILAFYTDDPNQIDRIFRTSALMRDKWDSSRADSTYGEMTINKALSVQTEKYNPAQNTPALPDQPDHEPDQLWPHYTLSQGLELPESEYLVYGAIEQNDNGMIYGDAAAGKTYLAIDLSVSLATGIDWMNRWKITKPRKVLYFIAEGRKKFFRRILASVNGMVERGYDVTQVYKLVDQNLIICTEVPQLFDVDLPRYVSSYFNYWQSVGSPKTDIFFIDTLHRASVGSEENSSKDAGLVVDAITWLQKQMNCAGCFVHHSNKTGGYRGSSAYRGNVDFVFKVEGIHREPRTLTIDKLRDGEHDGPIEGIAYAAKFKVDDATKGTYTTWLSEQDKETKESAKDKAKKEILEILNTHTKGLSQNQMVQMVGSASKNTVLDALKELNRDNKARTEPGPRSSILYYPHFDTT